MNRTTSIQWIFNNKYKLCKAYAKYSAYPYCFSLDIDVYGTRSYIGYKTIDEVIEFFKDFNRTKPNRHFCEIINSTSSKLFFDYDDLLVDDFELTIIQKSLVYYINKSFNTTITVDDLSIFTKRNNDNLHKSIHIVCDEVIADVKTTQKSLVVLLKANTTYWNTFLDDSIYTSNRAFFMPFNTKIKDTLTQNDYLKPFGTNMTKLTIDALITNNNSFSTIHTLQTQIHRPFKIYSMSIINRIYNFVKHWVEYNTKKQLMPIKQKQQIYISSKTLVADLLIICKILPSSFYNTTEDWNSFIHTIKSFGTTTDFEIFNKLSIQYSKNQKWTLQKNTDWFNSCKCRQYGLNTVCKIIDKYINAEYITNGIGSTIHYISGVLNINISKLTEQFDKIKSNNSFDIGDDTYYFDDDAKNLYKILDDETKLFIGNYIIDYEIPLMFKNHNNPLDNCITLTTINDIHPILNQWLDASRQLLGIKCSFGCGKTHIVINYLINKIIETQQQNRIIIITENNALNSQYAKSLASYGFISHQNIIDSPTAKLNNSKYIICSLESSARITFTPNDNIFIDEAESVLSHLSSVDTFKKTDKKITFNNLCSMFKVVQKIIILDADLSNERIKLINILSNNKLPNIIINTLDNRYADYNINIITMTGQFHDSIMNDLFNHKKIAVASTSKNKTILLFTEVRSRYPNKASLIINGNGASLYNTDTVIIIDKKYALLNLEQIIIENNIQFFIYSPTITTGVSINAPYFNKLFGYSCLKSVCVRTYIQSLFRCRNLIDKEIELHHAVGISNKLIEPIKMDEIIKYQFDVIDNFNNLTLTDEISKHIPIEYNPQYLQINILNQLEDQLSQQSFTNTLIYRLQNHKFNINLISKINTEDIPNDEPPSITTQIDERNILRLLTPRLYHYYKSNNIPIDKTELRLYDVVFGGNQNSFYIEGISDIKIPYCYKYIDTDNGNIEIEHDDQHLQDNDFTSNRLNIHRKYFYDYEIELYQQHIELYYFTKNISYICKVDDKGHSLMMDDIYYKLISVYNKLQKYYINKSTEVLQNNIVEYKPKSDKNGGVLDNNNQLNLIRNTYAIKIINLFDINLEFGLPTQKIKYIDFKKTIDDFIETFDFTQLLLINKHEKFDKTNKQYIGNVIILLNKYLEHLNIKIYILKDTHNYSKSTVIFNYMNFKCRTTRDEQSNKAIYSTINTSTPYSKNKPKYLTITHDNNIINTIRNDYGVIVDDPIDVLKLDDVLFRVNNYYNPNTELIISNTHISCKNKKYIYDAIPMYKINNGTTYKKTVISNELLAINTIKYVVGVTMNDMLDNVMNGFKNAISTRCLTIIDKNISIDDKQLQTILGEWNIKTTQRDKLNLEKLIETKYEPIIINDNSNDTFYYRNTAINKKYDRLRTRKINYKIILDTDENKLIELRNEPIKELIRNNKYNLKPIVCDEEYYNAMVRCN